MKGKKSLAIAWFFARTKYSQRIFAAP